MERVIPPAVCPECQNGKHLYCCEKALDLIIDVLRVAAAFVDCECPECIDPRLVRS